MSIDSTPFENIEVSLRAALTDAKMHFDAINEWHVPMEEEHHYFTETGFEVMNQFSDLDDDILEFTFELNYLISDDLSIVAEAMYNVFDDNQYYVYGDTTGSWFHGKLGVRYTF